MADVMWLSQEAQKIHDIFYGLFFTMAVVMLLIGVLVEYFKLPLSGSASFSSLIGRCLVATILLVAYPEITNWIADIGDGLADKIGGLNTLDTIIEKTLSVLETRSWSWTNMGDSLLWIIAYFIYAVLYLTVFIFDAIIMYGWTILYIFSPVLILMFILPQTAGATTLLFRSHIELASYKVVWSVLGTLLWSTALNNLNDDLKDKPNFFIVLGFMVIVAFSIIFTPKIVGALTKAGMSSASSQLGALGFGALSAGALGPAGLAGLMKGSVTVPMKTGFGLAKSGMGKAAKGLGKQWKNIRSSRSSYRNIIRMDQYRKTHSSPPDEPA